MIASLSRAFDAYSKKPFNFAWCSLLYIVMLLLFGLACIGFFIIYFLFMSVINQPVSFTPISITTLPTIIVSVFIALVFLFFANGLNGALATAYRRALERNKTSLVAFYNDSLAKAPVCFAIMLVRDLIWLVLVGPAIGGYVYVVLQGAADTSILLPAYLVSMTYAIIMTFIIHMVFTPALLSAGAFGTGMMASLRNSYRLLRSKHVYFVGLYAVFAVTWLLSFVPIIQLASLFFAYPITYGSLITMLESKGARMETEEE
jgi:hypothetical protein